MIYKIPQIVLDWYDRTEVKFEITKRLYNRELVLFVPNWNKQNLINTRMLKVHNVSHYDFVLKALKFFDGDKPYNFYYSLARYKYGIPHQTMNLEKRKRINSIWRGSHEKKILYYDFLLDIDCPTHDDIRFGYKSCKDIVEFLSSCQCPHEVRFSGKGFHIIIPGKYFESHLPQEQPFRTYSKDNIYFLYSRIAHFFHDNFSELVDKYIYDSRRVCKMPFSIALYENNCYVCYPFQTRGEFRDFKLKHYSLQSFTKPIRYHSPLIAFSRGSVNKLIREVDKK